MADISQIKLPDNTTYDINAKKVNSHTVGTDVPSGAVFTDTKNTAGSTDTSSKIYLIGATSQAANPQTYSDDQVYVENGKITSNSVESKSVVIKNSTDKSIIQLGRNAEAGSFIINNASGDYAMWGAGSTGTFNAQIFKTVSNASGNWKTGIMQSVDATNNYGKTNWYNSDGKIQVTINGDNNAFIIHDATNTIGPMIQIGIDGYNHGHLSLGNENGAARVYAYGSGEVYSQTYLAMDSNDNITAQIEGSSGKITCQKMSVSSGTGTFTKSSGSWTFKECHWRRTGNVVTVNIQFKGGGSNVSVGSNAIVGTINGVDRPPFTVRFHGYYSSTMLMGEYTSSGGFNVRILGSALNLATSNNAIMSGTFIVDD